MARSNLGTMLRRSLGPAIAIAVMAYFGSHAVFGGTGLIAWSQYRQQHDALDAKSRALASEQAAIEHRVALLDPARVDPDYADELVRDQLQVARADEVVVPLDTGQPKTAESR